jgi:GntR family transcriptional regulator/MocR family aminotransferase
LYDFHYGNREAVDFPYRLWRRLASRRMARAVPTRSPTSGFPPLTQALAAYLSRTRGVRCEPNQILIVNGSQQALDLIARILVNPGDDVILEEPHYHGARLAFGAAGAKLVPVAVDDEGLRVDDLKRRRRPARAIYITPSHQFPTGAVLPLPRRLALIDWVERQSAFLIEDDYDGELRYDCRPVEAVQALDRTGRVIYLGTFSKALSPELRLGYVVSPPQLLDALTAAKRVADLFAPTMLQEVVADFLGEGHYERHLRRLRDRNAARRQALLEATASQLGDRAVIAGVKAGMHAMLWLPTVPLKDLPTLVGRAEQAGVLVYANTNYYLGEPPQSGVVLSFSSLSEAEIHQGIKIFAKVVRSRW